MTESKGQATKNNILKEGLILASVQGLVNISIGGLAEKAQMSRSGLFAHFMSKEQLQLEILEYAHELFQETLIKPASALPSPGERLKFLAEQLPVWYDVSVPQIPGGCIFLTACLEFDDRPGKVKDYLMSVQKMFLLFLTSNHKGAVEMVQFKGNLTDDDFAFAFYSFYMGYHQYKKFFGDQNARKYARTHLNGLISFCTGEHPALQGL